MSALDENLARLTNGLTTAWLRDAATPQAISGLPQSEIEEVVRRFARFEAPLARLFPDSSWDGRIRSPLEPYPGNVEGCGTVWVKSDHRLPMTGSVKARGGVYELLCSIEDFAEREGLDRKSVV